MNETSVDLRLFNALHGNCVLVKANPPIYTVVAATEGYRQVAERLKDDIVGKDLFETFPANPNAPIGAGAHDVRLSLNKSLATKNRMHSLYSDMIHLTPAEFLWSGTGRLSIIL